MPDSNETPSPAEPHNGTTSSASPAPNSALSPLEQRVEQIRAERSRKQKAADEAVRQAMLEGEIKLAEIEANEGVEGRDFKAIFSSVDGAMVVVRKPKPVVHERFIKKQLDNKASVQDLDELVRSCLIYPDRPTFQKICDTAPNMLFLVSDAIVGLGGKSQEGLTGK